MSSLLELYQEIIVDHSQSPRHSGRLNDPTISSSGKNPLCGDKIELDIILDNGLISDIKCETSGCAISTAAASIMAEEIRGKTPNEALETVEKFKVALKTGDDHFQDSSDLKVFCNVSQYPTRVKCAALPWDTLKNALEKLKSN